MKEFDSVNFMQLEDRTLRADEVKNLSYPMLKQRVEGLYRNALNRLQYQEITYTEKTALHEIAVKAKEALMKNNQGALVSFYNNDYSKLVKVGTQSDFDMVEDFEYIIPETQDQLMPSDADISEYIYENSANMSTIDETKKSATATTSNETFFQKHKGKIIAGGIIGALALFGRGE